MELMATVTGSFEGDEVLNGVMLITGYVYKYVGINDNDCHLDLYSNRSDGEI
jgi:hypothetical protein